MADLTRSFNPYVDGVVNTGPTDKLTWTFGFAQSAQELGESPNDPHFLAFSEDRKTIFRNAIAEYAAVCIITFTETPTSANPDIITGYYLGDWSWSGLTAGGPAG